MVKLQITNHFAQNSFSVDSLKISMKILSIEGKSISQLQLCQPTSITRTVNRPDALSDPGPFNL